MFCDWKRCKRCQRICNPNFKIDEKINEEVFENTHDPEIICMKCVEELARNNGLKTERLKTTDKEFFFIRGIS
ncbi:MAG: hypothetical protein ACOCP4_05585 [Candidatus Woesearchaeota archaeon]